MAFLPVPPFFSGNGLRAGLSVPAICRRDRPLQDITCAKRHAEATRTSTDKGTKNKRGPRDTVSRKPPQPSLRLQKNIARGRGGEAEFVRRALRNRHDALIVGTGLPGKLSAALSARERSEHALVVVATRSEARRAAAEISLDARGSTIILAAGGGGDSWAHPAMNANSSLNSVIVIATPRAVVAEFCASPHGRPWLSKVRFLTVVDPHRLVSIGCEKHLRRIFRALRVRDHRKNVVIAMREIDSDVEKFSRSILRDEAKVDVINWGTQELPVYVLSKEELKSDARVRQCKQYFESSTASGVCASLLAALRAHNETEGKHKLLVFFTTARLAEYFALVFRGRGFAVLDIHGKTAPARKEELMENLYSAEKAVVFSCDAIAHNTLLPPIDQVIQIGLPASLDQYLRRVSLLAGGDAKRHSCILLLQSEMTEALNLFNEAVQVERREGSSDEDWMTDEDELVPENARKRAYQSWLAYYRRHRRKLGWDRPELVRQANTWAMKSLGKIPALEKKVVDRLFLRGIDGIRIAEQSVD